MKLDRPNVTLFNHGGELLSVVCHCSTLGRHWAVIGVTEVHEAAVVDILQHSRGTRNLQLTPAHVRHLKHALQPCDAALQQAKARRSGSLVATLIQGLKPQADSQEGLARGYERSQRLKQPAIREALPHCSNVALDRKS